MADDEGMTPGPHTKRPTWGTRAGKTKLTGLIKSDPLFDYREDAVRQLS